MTTELHQIQCHISEFFPWKCYALCFALCQPSSSEQWSSKSIMTLAHRCDCVDQYRRVSQTSATQQGTAGVPDWLLSTCILSKAQHIQITQVLNNQDTVLHHVFIAFIFLTCFAWSIEFPVNILCQQTWISNWKLILTDFESICKTGQATWAVN